MRSPWKSFIEVVTWDLVRWIVVVSGCVPGILGVLVRFVLLWPLFGEVRGFFRILEHVTFEYPRRLKIGRNVGVNTGCWINARGGVSIGDHTIIGPACVIHSANHRADRLDVPIRSQGYEFAPVNIGRNVWLGAHVTVLPGVTIGDNSIVGAGAVVTRDIPENAIAVGVPARVQRMRVAVGRTVETAIPS